MVWDFAESNPFSGVTGSWSSSLEWIPRVLERCPIEEAVIFQANAATANPGISDYLLTTDPPYYSSITYADLSDYFYGTFRYCLKDEFSDNFLTLSTPKQDEAVAAWHKFDGDRQAAGHHFTNLLRSSFANCNRHSHKDYPTVIFYAFKSKQLGNSEDPLVTAWESILRVIIDSGLTIERTWPIRTERTSGRKVAKNTLASSIVVVCRKQRGDTAVTTRGDFIQSLNSEVSSAIKLLQHGNIAPVDMAQSSIGPGMAIFTRYSKVLESDDSAMTVRTALQLINQAVDGYLSEQEAEFDADTRFAVTWFEQFGMEKGDSGDADTLATARNISVAGVVNAGILESRGGNVRLLLREEMTDDWDPVTDRRLTIWECTQYLIRSLESEGEAAAADLLARVGSRGEVARDLAYRLYGICERKGWADEGRAYNGLVVAWPEVSLLAAQERPTGPTEPELGL